jgi:hypothetical protein
VITWISGGLNLRVMRMGHTSLKSPVMLCLCV